MRRRPPGPHVVNWRYHKANPWNQEAGVVRCESCSATMQSSHLFLGRVCPLCARRGPFTPIGAEISMDKHNRSKSDA